MIRESCLLVCKALAQVGSMIRPGMSGDQIDRVAEELIRDGAAQIVIIARGADGSVLATQGARHFCRAAEVPVKSKTGAGDSFLAAFTLALAQEADHPTALTAAVAAASAAVMTEATELCRAEDALRLIADCPSTPL